VLGDSVTEVKPPRAQSNRGPTPARVIRPARANSAISEKTDQSDAFQTFCDSFSFRKIEIAPITVAPTPEAPPSPKRKPRGREKKPAKTAELCAIVPPSPTRQDFVKMPAPGYNEETDISMWDFIDMFRADA
jgi:hypothetical protein